jgi:hypothetical protein
MGKTPARQLTEHIAREWDSPKIQAVKNGVFLKSSAPQMNCAKIWLYFADHMAVSLLLLPLTEAQCSAFLEIQKYTLQWQTLIDFMTTVISYSTLATESKNLLGLWNRMK